MKVVSYSMGGKTQKQEIGEWGEEQAALFLSRQGYEIIKRNYILPDPRRKAEVDIIAWHEKNFYGRTLCFIEVKTRSYGLGSAERATGKKKKKNIKKAALQYCLENKIDIDRQPIQFEQVSVYVNKKRGTVNLRKYEIPCELTA